MMCVPVIRVKSVDQARSGLEIVWREADDTKITNSHMPMGPMMKFPRRFQVLPGLQCHRAGVHRAGGAPGPAVLWMAILHCELISLDFTWSFRDAESHQPFKP